MIEINATHVTAYLEPIMFKWSPCLIDLWREDDATTFVTVRIIDQSLGKNVMYNIDFFEGVSSYSLDISGALQTMGEDIRVIVQTGGHTGYANIYNIDGANSILANYGGEYHVRMWDGYDMTLPMLYYNQVTIYLGRRGTPVTVASYPANTQSGYKFNEFTPTLGPGRYYLGGIIRSGAVWEQGQWAFEVVSDCVPKNPIYLRWTDNSGLRWYWLFEQVGTVTSVAEDLIYGRLVSWYEDDVNEWTDERSRIVSRTAKIVTHNVTSDEYKVVKTLATSSIVDAYDEGSGIWYRVRISDGEYSDPKGNYKEVEFTIEFAPTKTQLP